MEKYYNKLVQRYAVDKDGKITKERVITDILPQFFDYPDKTIRRVARTKAFCNYVGKWTDYSPDSNPFFVPTTNRSAASNPGPSLTSTLSFVEDQNSIDPPKSLELVVNPNCVSDNIHFSIKNMEEPFSEIQVNLYELTSRSMIYSSTISNVQKDDEFTLNKILDGGTLYILQVKVPGGYVLSTKVCKQ